ncbi:MAG: nickel pincer cofactor biosynthesis protein LarC [Gloeomargarita sp. SKYBB_i_bin120]|nr:nickel pincer cofactor biosynthesis protein LarC [Gloeomargarita sp. SKYG98]MCS7293341.1 nickel pincer cofactor biosynthesis protein LarC [Gloeomargarita sp. SKYB120]MDW8178906.1 nickel pincer cofactor biosynthesis protein LarC [Gloeomargarita sp. SKYBB_i_bin120]
MERVAYFDCPTGIAGDMCLGALVDAGLPMEVLQRELQGLGMIGAFTLTAETVQRQGQRATQVQVHPQQAQPSHRDWADIRLLLAEARLAEPVKRWSQAIFANLAVAEGAVHGVPPEQVHFHEVGAVDAIVDIVGTCIGLHYFGVTQVYCSALPLGSGQVQTAHGRLAVPTPAVLYLCQAKQVPIYDNGLKGELVTPTGAAIVTTLAQAFGSPPPMQLERVGWGAGTQELPMANVLRLWLGPAPVGAFTEPVVVLETQMDDLSPQGLAYACEQLLAAGALDVWSQAVTMKKGRQGVLLQVLCSPERANACETILFRETTTLGVRRRWLERRVLPRRLVTVSTEWGDVAVKVAEAEGRLLNVQPEYEDCARIARTYGLPWKQVHQRVMHRFWKRWENADAQNPN